LTRERQDIGTRSAPFFLPPEHCPCLDVLSKDVKVAAGIFAVDGSSCQDGLPAIADGTPEPIEDHRAPVGGCTTDSGFNGAARYRPAPVCAA
jgi:hypothetical protein